MKVMLNPTIGTTLSCRGNSSMAKQAGKDLPAKSEGLSNEQIYNAIIRFQNKLVQIFTGSKKTNVKLNTIA